MIGLLFPARPGGKKRMWRHSALLLAAPLLSFPIDAPAAVAGTTDRLAPPADADADALVARMTLDEKLGMLSGTFGSAVRRQNPGDQRVGAGHVPGVPRLQIPDLFETDGGLGVANSGTLRPGDIATAMPSALAVAASFSPEIAYRVGAVMGAEARAKGFNVLLAGGVNLTRDAWGGRNFEYFGEDPLLSGLLGGESIRGIQSNHIVATVKHFALNAQESGRYVLDARIGGAALRESDLLAFQLAIEHGRPGAVMCAYNKVGGAWACENKTLLTRILRDDWGYRGWVMSDWGAVHSTTTAALAGLDQQSGRELDKAPYFGEPLRAAVARGEVPVERIDAMVHHILVGLIETGVADHPAPSAPQPIDYPNHALVAQQAAESGMVLLRNRDDILPIPAKATRIAVIGAHAMLGVMSGGGSSQVQGASGAALRLPINDGPHNLSFIKRTWIADSPLAAIRARAPGALVTYQDGSNLAAAAKAAGDADIAIVFVEQWRSEALDLESLELPDKQDDLVSAVARANPRTVVVLQTGGAVLMPWIERVGAVLQAWYPGDRGGRAIARILFGDIDPGGRLPLTFPANASQLPRPSIPGLDKVREALVRERQTSAAVDATTVDISGGIAPFAVPYAEGSAVGYRWFARKGGKPLFPFGFGLSYSRFTYQDLEVDLGSTPHVSFTVRNVGGRAGIAVPQVYATIPDEAGGGASRRLVGFERLGLAAGQAAKLSIVIDPRLLANFSISKHGWVARRKRIDVSVGTSAIDPVLTRRSWMIRRSILP